MAGDALFGTKLTQRTKLVQKITPESKHPFKFVMAERARNAHRV